MITRTFLHAPKTGSVLITFSDERFDASILPLLKVLIDGVPPLEDALEIREEERQILVRDVPIGECRLTITHDSILKEEERLVVQSGQQTVYSAKLRPAMVRLIVNCEPGAKIYVNDKYYAEVPHTRETGILEFPPGNVTVKAIHNEFKTRTHSDHFPPGDQELELPLERLVFSQEFSDGFGEGARFWQAPQTWQVESGRLNVSGAGIGLLRERVYRDFKVQLLMSLENRRGAVWVLRARDENNYYLFQLTGPDGNPPRLLRSFLCQNGETKLLKSDPVIDDLSGPTDTVQIVVEAIGDTIKHSIKVSSAPKSEEPQPLSVLSDKTFSTGTLGFGTKDSEEFTVYFVSIIPAR